MKDFYDTLQIMNRRLGLLNKNCCQTNNMKLSPILSHILYEIDKQNNPSMQTIADLMGTDITTFSRQIQSLIKMHLVEKRPLPTDKRVYILHLTADGKNVVEELREQMNDYLDDIFKQMNDFEKQAVMSAFALFTEKMSETKGCCNPVNIHLKQKQ